jgi:hypothetical protein
MPHSKLFFGWISLLAISLSSEVNGNTLDTEPQTRNSPVISVPDPVKVDPFSGSAGYAYKIEVPLGQVV